MGSACRFTTVADTEKLAEFLSRVFGASPGAGFVAPRMLQWKYWEPRQDYPEPRSMVIEQDGRIVAHVGLWPISISSTGKKMTGVHMIDWAADPHAPGAGLSLLQRLAKQFDFIYSIGGSGMTQSVLPKFGFRTVAKTLVWARPLRPWKQMIKHQTRDLRLPLRFARNLLWSRLPSGRLPADWTAAPAGIDEVEPANTGSMRDKGFFRYLQLCPVGRCSVFNLLNGNRVAGFFALLTVQEQTRIAGFWLDNSSPGVWRAAFQLAREAAIKHTEGSELIASCASEDSAFGAKEAGMRLRARIPVFLYRADSSCEPLPLQFHMSDNDSIFYADQAVQFLT